MSALARWFKSLGCEVAGYDRTPTQLTDQLQTEGIDIHFDDRIEHIPAHLISEKTKSLVIYTPAIPNDHKQFNYLLSKGLDVLKRAEVLGILSEEMFTIAVAGTHGKTTTSSMIAHILYSNHVSSLSFLGGISSNYDSNFLICKNDDKMNVLVVEADEYDRSFLQLHPNIAVITSMDTDHLDIYGDKESLAKSFKQFISRIDSQGILFVNETIAHDMMEGSDSKCQVITYAGKAGDHHAEGIRVENTCFVFDYRGGDQFITGLRLKMPGYHNVENAIAAIAVCSYLGLNADKIVQAISHYSGVKRRFQYIFENPKVVYIDDYAHHPTEIEALLYSLNAMYPQKNITAVFQPHLYSRTRDMYIGLAKSLSSASRIILLEIYPAREQPIEGITSEIIYHQLEEDERYLTTMENLLAVLDRSKLEVLVTIGAGDIDKIVEPIKKYLIKKYEVA